MSDLPKELFKPAAPRDIEELPHTVSRGFFADALSRFWRFTASKIALSVIALILLFSIFVPLFSTRRSDMMDPYYAKLAPRIERLGIRAERERRVSATGLVRIASIGMTEGESLGESVGKEMSPLIKAPEADGRIYTVGVDTYLEVGFIYKTVDREEYLSMLEYERETGEQLLYPLIATNEYNPEPDNANSWYKMASDGAPLDGLGEPMTVTEELRLYDNYLRDEGGNTVYTVASGGGDNESAGVKVRLLYYSYYKYKTGTSPDYLFGLDSQGYDLALRLADGIRLSLLIATLVSLINFTIGAVVGAVEGYFGGAVDLVLERVTDVLSGVPFIVVATLFQIYLADRVGPIPSLLFAFVLTGWLGTANRVRLQFYRFKKSEYVLAARTLGASHRRIIWRHIFPNTLGTLITASALVIPGVIFQESMLSFLGIVNLGGESLTSLGTLLADASGVWINYPHLMLFPALTISLLMISFNIFGEGLRDAFNPRTKGGV